MELRDRRYGLTVSVERAAELSRSPAWTCWRAALPLKGVLVRRSFGLSVESLADGSPLLRDEREEFFEDEG